MHPGSESATEVEKISVAAQQSLEKMSEIVWSLNPRNDKLENLVAYIRKYAMEYLENSPVQCSVTMSGSIPDAEITGEQRRKRVSHGQGIAPQHHQAFGRGVC